MKWLALTGLLLLGLLAHANDCNVISGYTYYGNCSVIGGYVYCADPGGNCSVIGGYVYCGYNCQVIGGYVNCDGKQQAPPAQPARPSQCSPDDNTPPTAVTNGPFCNVISGYTYYGSCSVISGYVYCANPGGNCSVIGGYVYCGDSCQVLGGYVNCGGVQAQPAQPAQPSACIVGT